MQIAVTWDRNFHKTSLTDYLNDKIKDGNVILSVVPAIYVNLDDGKRIEAAVIIYDDLQQTLSVTK